MTHADTFLQAILADPDDDAPRLIYADWLEDRDDPRGTFIRVQCTLATLPDDHPSRQELEDEEQDLLRSHKEEWNAAFQGVAKQWEFTRGFVEELSLSDQAFHEHGVTIFGAHPIQRVHFVSLERCPQEIAASTLLARVTDLELGGSRQGSVSFLHALVASPHLGRLRHLGLSSIDLEWPLIQLLTESSLLKQLHRLDLSHNRGLADRAARAIASIPAVGQLMSLNLSGTNLTWRGLQDLLGAQNLSSLTDLGVGIPNLLAGLRSPSDIFSQRQAAPLLSRLNSLDLADTKLSLDLLRPLLKQLRAIEDFNLSGNALGNDGAHALARATHLNHLESLHLQRVNMSAEGLQALAEAPHLANLRVLDLYKNHVRDTGAKAIAESSYLTQLSELGLRSNQIGGPGIAALALSPNLAQLHFLDLSENYVGVEAVEALAQSPHFSRLKTLRLRGNGLDGPLPPSPFLRIDKAELTAAKVREAARLQLQERFGAACVI